jgi:cytochrome c-type biogenesis protein
MEISFSLGGIIISFVAGLLSFLSPCVLPLVPAYLGYVSGLNVMEIKSGKGGRRVVAGILAFVLGFSLVFTLMGLTASAVGVFLAKNKKVISVIAGILLIIFGLHLVGIMRIPFLDYEKKAHINVRSANLFLSFLMGITFALGWTPCIGPTLSGILALAAISGTVLQGGILLFVYSLGLGIPFILSGILASKVFEFISRVRTLLRYFEIASGILLVALGILLITGLLAYLSYIFPNWEPPI